MKSKRNIYEATGEVVNFIDDVQTNCELTYLQTIEVVAQALVDYTRYYVESDR